MALKRCFDTFPRSINVTSQTRNLGSKKKPPDDGGKLYPDLIIIIIIIVLNG